MTNAQPLPRVSVVIPCRNELGHISRCIESVLSSSYPIELLDVIVVDGMSDDGTIDEIKKLFGGNNRVQIIENQKRTTPVALNLGIKQSNAEYIMILGAHSEISNNYIINSIKHLLDDSKLGCSGGLLRSISINDNAKIISMAMSSAFGVGTSHFRTGLVSGYVDTVAFGVYPKKIFEEIGYFDEELTRNQDDEMSYRILKHGYKIFLDINTYATYYVRSSFRKLAAQQFQYGYWKVYVNKKHQSITTFRQLVPLFFLLYLISLPLGLYIHRTYVLPLVIYVLAAFVISISRTYNPLDIIKQIFAFIVLHLSYGYGYLRGIIDFLILNKKQVQQHTHLTR
jgi:glycosyltransferase involved in cell wall biosynthesis